MVTGTMVEACGRDKLWWERKPELRMGGGSQLFSNSIITRTNQNPTRIASLSESNALSGLMISQSAVPLKGPTTSTTNTLETHWDTNSWQQTTEWSVSLHHWHTLYQCLLRAWGSAGQFTRVLRAHRTWYLALLWHCSLQPAFYPSPKSLPPRPFSSSWPPRWSACPREMLFISI